MSDASYFDRISWATRLMMMSAKELAGQDGSDPDVLAERRRRCDAEDERLRRVNAGRVDTGCPPSPSRQGPRP